MEVAHRKFSNEWGQFDRYCKLVLYHESIDMTIPFRCAERQKRG